MHIIDVMVSHFHRALTELHKRLIHSEEETQRLAAAIKDKDRQLEQVRHHSLLLAQICQRRPLLEALVSLLAEAEGMPCLPIPVVERSNGLLNAVDYPQSEEDLEGSDTDRTLFGTTVWGKWHLLIFTLQILYFCNSSWNFFFFLIFKFWMEWRRLRTSWPVPPGVLESELLQRCFNKKPMELLFLSVL